MAQSDLPRISPYLSQNGVPSQAKQRFERHAHLVAVPAGYLAHAIGYAVLALDHRSILPRDNLYGAVRVGKDGEEWVTRKLRTMPMNAEHAGRSATKEGSSRAENFVRRKALDEGKQLGMLNIVGAERPELAADREAQRAVLAAAGLNRLLNILDSGREVVEPSAMSSAALYGHLPFEKEPETAEATTLMRAALTAHYYESAMLETDKKLFMRSVPELRRINRQRQPCGALDLIKCDTPETMVGSFMVLALHEYPEVADVLQKMGQLE